MQQILHNGHPKKTRLLSRPFFDRQNLYICTFFSLIADIVAVPEIFFIQVFYRAYIPSYNTNLNKEILFMHIKPNNNEF